MLQNTLNLISKLDNILIVKNFKCLNTLRTGDADLRFYITTVQDG